MNDKYDSVPDRISSDSFEDKWMTSQPARDRRRRKDKVIVIINGVFFLISCAVLLYSWRITHDRDPTKLMKILAPYSPVLDSLPIRLQSTEVLGTLFDDYSPHNIFRANPSPEVDKAWEDMARIEYFGVDAAAIRKLGKDPKTAVKIPEAWSLKKEPRFLVELDVQHQLHCLNEIRKYAFFDHYYGNSYANISMAPRRHQAHLSHCIHILLQALTCTPSLDLISHVWMRTQENPYPDFNINRQCVAHDPLLAWQKNVSISEEIKRFKIIPRPEDAIEVEPEPTLLLIGQDLGQRLPHEDRL